MTIRVEGVGIIEDVPWPDDDPWSVGDELCVGPCRIDCPTTSIMVPSGWTARRAYGMLRLDRVSRAHGVLP